MSLWISIHLPNLCTADTPPLPNINAGSCSQVPERLKRALFAYTPRLAPWGAASLVLDIESSLRLFGGPRRLCHLVRATVQTACPQHNAVLSLAPTALGAWVLANQPGKHPRRYLRLSSFKQRLRTVPVSCLPAACPYIDWLHSLGVTTLGKLLALPRAGLLQRTSSALGHQLDALTGREKLPLPWYPEPDTFQASLSLDSPITVHAQVLHAIYPLLQQLAHWLQLRQLAVLAFVLQLRHHNHPSCPPVSHIRIRLSVPSWRVSDIQPLVAETLHHHNLPAAVLELSLTQLQTQPRPAQSTTLFPDAHFVQRQESQLLDLLVARLGPQHILQPRVYASHLPEQASQWLEYPNPPQPAGQGPNLISSPQAFTMPRPFWMLNPAQPLHSHNDQPVYQGLPLRLVEGPERIETGWWLDGRARQRDYFIAQDDHNRRYWIYHQRGSDQAFWFLQGLFA